MSSKVTPAITALTNAGIRHTIHEYDHRLAGDLGFGPDAARQLGVDPARVFKTLIVALDQQATRLAVVIAPSTGEVDLSASAGALGAKRAVLADPVRAERATGYVVGGISPFGQRKPLPTAIDESAQGFPTIFVSAGRRGLEVEVGPGDLMTLLDARAAAITRA